MTTLPAWIDEDLSPYDLAGILHTDYKGGIQGCASGAYMTAVTYHEAEQVMKEHGDDVLSYLEEVLGFIPQVPNQTAVRCISSFYLTKAVEAWAIEHMHLADWENDEPITELTD